MTENIVLHTYTSLYVHLIDQLQWELLLPEEVRDSSKHILQKAGKKFGVVAPVVEQVEVSLLVKAWAQMVLSCLEGRYDG
jgi:hypothetical protein